MIELSKTQKRIDWIDALKGFAIFCVTLGHCNVWFPIEQYIYSFHMFLFFFLSGFLFSVNLSPKQALKKCVKRLLIPFLSYNILSALIKFFIEKDFLQLVEEIFVINGNLTWNSPIWFLLVLFITETIFILFKLYKHTWISITAIIVCLIIWVFVGHKWILWKLNLVPMALSFFLFGYLFKTLVPIVRNWYILFLLGIGSIIFSMLNIRIVYTHGKFGNYIYCILAAFCGVLFFVGLFSCVKILSRFKFLITWGKNSLPIMATQYFIFKTISIVSLRLFNFDLMKYQNSVVSFVLALITIMNKSKR